MGTPNPQALSRLFSRLLNRNVAFEQAGNAEGPELRKAYALYTVFPGDGIAIVKADLAVLGSFAGALVGFPDTEVKTHLSSEPMDETFQDAIHEVLNIASGAIADGGRVVFSRMTLDAAGLSDAEKELLRKPNHTVRFNVSVAGYQDGELSLFS